MNFINKKSYIQNNISHFKFKRNSQLYKLVKPLVLSASLIVFSTKNSFAFLKTESQSETTLPSVLKADNVTGDENNNSIIAEGNVEVSRGSSIIYADKMLYNQNQNNIKAIGNVKVKNIEVGNLKSSEAEVKEDFSNGVFIDNTLVLSDGSYLLSPKIERKSPTVTNIKKSIYSLCPNPEINENNDLAGKKSDLLSIKSNEFTIDRETQNFKIKHGVVRLYDVPFFYTPYLKAPLPAKKRQSGFLYPSYSKNSRLGLGFNVPYYFNISPDKELTTTPTYYPSTGQILINNEFYHLTSYGEYKTDVEVGNNRVNPLINSFNTANNTSNTSNTDNLSTNSVLNSRKSNKEYRWHLKGNGKFDFTNNSGLDFILDNTSDASYLRDYHFDYRGYSFSKANLDYIKGREYYSIKTIRIQEFENIGVEKTNPIIPIIETHNETKPLFYKEKFSLSSNTTVITRDSGLQYRRASVIPEVDFPVNIKGNLFNLNAKIQTDYYSLENNFKYSTPSYQYASNQTNYRPEISLNWKLPLIKKTKDKSFVIEPMANIISSSYKKNFNNLASEDSNNSDLTISNIFISERFSGFDRNESGERVNYGFKSSYFNSENEYGLTLGQSYRMTNRAQDVTIRGFNGDRSNLVGLASFRSSSLFYISYFFQLNDTSYKNEVSEITSNLNLDRVKLTSNYISLQKTSQRPNPAKQLNLSSEVKINEKYSTKLILARDMITGRNINRSISINYNGCCTIFGFMVTESNPSNLTKAQKSFNLTLSFKNL